MSLSSFFKKESKTDILANIMRRQGHIFKEYSELSSLVREYLKAFDNLDKMHRTLLIKIKAMADYHGLTFDSDNGKYVRKNKKN
ncbi:MAG: hypothetical protein V1779_17750 [bacterium]